MATVVSNVVLFYKGSSMENVTREGSLVAVNNLLEQLINLKILTSRDILNGRPLCLGLTKSHQGIFVTRVIHMR